MEVILYIVIGSIIGAVVGWLIAKSKTTSDIQVEKDVARQKFSELEKEFVGYKATAISQLQTANENLDARLKEIAGFNQTIQAEVLELSTLNKQLSTANADLRAANQTILDKNLALDGVKEELKIAKNDLSISNQALATAKANNEALNEKLQTQKTKWKHWVKNSILNLKTLPTKFWKLKRRSSLN
ncbi:MAG: hypothetical protein IPP32_16615 [Bacteroidetes bacterium]|nr:hypothetical protein [Bacteroidota bacterium]